MEPRIIVDIKDLERLTKEFPEASLRARESRLTEALLLIEGAIKQLTPVGAGPIHARDTIFQNVNFHGENVVGIVGMPVMYGAPLEYGAKPHFPPVAPIMFWVEKKLGLAGKAAQSAAFCIARAISKRGTTGAHMFGKGFEMNEARVVAILNQIPDDICRRVNA